MREFEQGFFIHFPFMQRNESSTASRRYTRACWATKTRIIDGINYQRAPIYPNTASLWRSVVHPLGFEGLFFEETSFFFNVFVLEAFFEEVIRFIFQIVLESKKTTYFFKEKLQLWSWYSQQKNFIAGDRYC